MSADTLNPIKLVKVRDETVEVRELRWGDFLHAFKQTFQNLSRLYGGEIVLDVTNLKFDKDKLLEAIGDQEKLVSWLIQKSTGKDEAWASSLSVRDVLPILTAIIELNLSQEIIDLGKPIAGRVKEAFGLKSLSPDSPTRSSAPATPSATSKR